MSATEVLYRLLMKNEMTSPAIHLVTSARAGFVLALLVTAAPAVAFAHNSTKAVEMQIDTRERYLELTDQVAPGFVLQDTQAHRVRLDDFRGKVVVLNFVYARCEQQCPLHSLKIAEVQQQLALASLSEGVQFVTIATDTEDAASTAESMRAHGPRYGLDPANWVFLQGGKGLEDLGMRFAAAYGLKFVLDDDGKQMHGVVTFLIDSKGKLRARYHGLDFNSVNLTIHAAALVHDAHSRNDDNTPKSTQPSVEYRQIATLLIFSSLGILLCMAIFYYRKQHHGRRRPRVKKSASSTQERDQ